ncbi:MAG TPA: four helix bundle protein [Thermoanaerobaculia bacterium]|nr:four helix bundle protein [Thermoanaerobaculia bacterium]
MFALRVMRLGDSLPRSRSANVVAYQVIKSGSSVGAHYREGMRSRSPAETISKLEGALMELEETAYWMSLIVDLNLVASNRLAPLRKEADELTAILVTCVKKLKARRR